MSLPWKRFNTASGMDCMQFAAKVQASMRETEFQYRKRYGLHAIRRLRRSNPVHVSFQYRKRYGLHAITLFAGLKARDLVSIPQAVWIACNTVSRKPWKQ